VSGPEAAGLRAVLFDMDGLLVDSEPLWFEAETTVMALMGSAWSHADQQRLVGRPMKHSLGYMLARAARPVPEETVERWLADGITSLVRQRGVPMLPGARELITEVKAAGLPCALVTSAQPDLMNAVLETIGAALRAPVLDVPVLDVPVFDVPVFDVPVFDVTVCAADVQHGKPDPEPYRLAARLLGVPPGCCVALEDSHSGVASAETAGFSVIAVPNVAAVPARPGRIIVSSLGEVNLARLRQVAAGHARSAVTNES
jgi:beta-phosphoglucomutase-like phosphatase (HAD superfamily)